MARRRPRVSAAPVGIMGTTCSLVAVARDSAEGEKALAEAEQALRDVEALMSAHLDSSEVLRLNRAPAEEEAVLSADGCSRVKDAVWKLDEADFITTLMELLQEV